MYWTFDPLESRNAHLNLNVLGAAVERYVPHFYGETPVAVTDSVIGTDRFVVRWDLREDRALPENPKLRLSDIPSVTPDSETLPPTGTTVRVKVGTPADIQTLKTSNPELAVQWRKATRRAFTHYLDAGYAIAEFRVEQEGRGGWYVLIDQA
jgi:predicted GNAT superfamily acetyltransferase